MLPITRKQFRKALAAIEEERRDSANQIDGLTTRILLYEEETVLRTRYMHDREARKAARRRYAGKKKVLPFALQNQLMVFPKPNRDAFLRLAMPHD